MRKTSFQNKSQNRFTISFPVLAIIAISTLIIFSSFYEKSWSYNWDGIRKQIKDSIEVAKFGGISSGAVGYYGRKPQQFDRRHWIMKNATESELLKLIDYPNATIKAIAYQGLIYKKDFTDKTNLVLRSFDEVDYPIEYGMGCVGTRMYISEYLIDFVLFINDKRPPPPVIFRNRYQFSKEDIEKIMDKYQTYRVYKNE